MVALSQNLVNRLFFLEWEASEYWRRGATFDPNADYDGGGASSINEAYAGTDPFDPEDALRITAFSLAPAEGTREAEAAASDSPTLTFPTVPGRAYTVETTTNLVGAVWTATDFYGDSAAKAPVSVLAIPSGAKASTATVYLLPSTNSAAFFRIHAK